MSGQGNPERAARILVVDDHPVVRQGLSLALGRQSGLSVCGEAEGLPDALRAIEALHPDLVLADLDLDVVVLPAQEDEFTCVSCFLVKHQSQFDHDTKLGPVCHECSL